MLVKLYDEFNKEINYESEENLESLFNYYFNDTFAFEVDEEGASFIKSLATRLPTLHHEISEGKYFWCIDLEMFLSKNQFGEMKEIMERFFG